SSLVGHRLRLRLRLGVLVAASPALIAVVAVIAVVARLGALLVRQRLDVARRQTDLLVVPVDLDDPGPHRLADVEELVELLLAVALDLGDVRESLDAVGDPDEQPEGGDLSDRADDLDAVAVGLRAAVPLVG